MPKRDSAPIGAPCWIDLFSSDTDRAQAFYGELLGWTADSAGPEYGGYINFSKDGIRVAGCMKNDGATGAPDAWTVYLATDDIQKLADAAVANGGQLIVAPMAVVELGSMAVLTDVGQAVVGAWQPGLHAGFGVFGEEGTASWFELHTRDYDASVRFYEDVFKWDVHTMGDTPEFRYATLGEGDAALAGIMDASGFLPDGVPSNWQVYFGVRDADASLVTIVDLGGSILAPAEDTPYGRLAQAADPTGAVFRIVQPPA
jgi:predicted enzyme related to lactoylglutathione lyase